ncbi:MAG: DegT/DnrJ/EryC1/StrS family aminotransferase, partial [Ignavibacteria bacterium]|nr:DegT/DnrJ/EryC1/StrS family aminotransferase [Ignavibacteria bacterium]
GEGGALVTGDKYIYDRARLIRSHGRENEDRFVSLGYNFRMPDMCAALGVSQLAKLDKLIEMRRQIAEGWYLDGLLGTGYSPTIGDSIYQLYTVRMGAKRDAVMRHLQESGIGCKVYFKPVHLSEYYRQNKWQPERLPVTERVSSEVLSLPMYPGLTESEVEYVCEKVKEAL